MSDAAALLGTRGLVRIRGVIDGEPFEGALMAQGDSTHRLPVKAKLRQAIGKEAGDTRHGAQVVVAARSLEHGRAAAKEIGAGGGPSPRMASLDLVSLASDRRGEARHRHARVLPAASTSARRALGDARRPETGLTGVG